MYVIYVCISICLCKCEYVYIYIHVHTFFWGQDNLGYVGGFGDLPLARAVLLGEAHGSKGQLRPLALKWVCLKLSPSILIC